MVCQSSGTVHIGNSSFFSAGKMEYLPFLLSKSDEMNFSVTSFSSLLREGNFLPEVFNVILSGHCLSSFIQVNWGKKLYFKYH